MSWFELAAVAGAGGVGAIIRFLAGIAIRGDSARATLAVNLTASFLAGLFAHLLLGPGLTAVLVSGFCGGLSTYSAFSVRAAEQLTPRRWGRALGNIALTLLGGTVAAWLGIMLGSLLAPVTPV